MCSHFSGEIIATDGKALRHDYVLALKVNQGIAHEEIRSFFDYIVPTDPSMKNPPSLDRAEYLETVDVDHGRIDVRESKVVSLFVE